MNERRFWNGRSIDHKTIFWALRRCNSRTGFKEWENMQTIGRQINAFLGQIKDRDRIMFVQRYWFCYTVGEIAKALGVSKNYVIVHLHVQVYYEDILHFGMKKEEEAMRSIYLISVLIK